MTKHWGSPQIDHVSGFLRQLTKAGWIVWHDLRANKLGQRWPLKPVTLNLLANDICNSKCQMCLIWKRKRDKEMTPTELAQILQDPLFDRLRYVGVSGGEPTLRPDLPEIYRVLVQKKPTIKSAGIITNAIRAQDVISRVTESAEICRDAGVTFQVMVSLDGVGDVHDLIRGRPGNFESALEVIHYFRDKTDIPVLFGCTITKDNVWHVDDLYDFVCQEGLYGHFRVAEFIQRLYNEEQNEFIRNFTPLERYHLGLFFTKLEQEYERNLNYRRTYRNIRAMLLEGAKRTIRCPYQTEAVVLDCRGQLLYCSPKSPIIGNTLASSAKTIYLGNIVTRKQILARDCDNCIHDYHAPPTTHELLQQALTRFWHSRLNVRLAWAGRAKSSDQPRPKAGSAIVKSAFIVGWYGTETAGDKAILGEIVHQLERQGVERVTLASLNPYFSKWTVRELGYPEIEVVPTFSSRFLRCAAQADETIMGGGPLMDIAAMGSVLWAFRQAKTSGRRTRIAGCGIGPLQQSKYIAAVKQLLSLADVVELRDSRSVQWAIEHTGRHDIVFSGDPAVGFVRRWQLEHSKQIIPRQRTLNCYFREWTREYQGNLSAEEFASRKEEFEKELGTWVTTVCRRLSLQPRLLAMHPFVKGGDDRTFNRQFAEKYLYDLEPVVEIRPYSVHDILYSMQEATLCLTMRFHSVLFAHTLGVPFLAIDYTQGGKISNFLVDNSAVEKMLTLDQVAGGQWQALAAGPVSACA
ncbi:MAG: radical SAM protein [Chloroflexi bacterium]|nr:radical SAM protein [Chloroflexota bacterium]MCI0725294.1 radical SAM protein [Chloroflexota bacterium]